jgi:hypothetical protein
MLERRRMATSNAYGFDFLRSEHQLPQEIEASNRSTGAIGASAGAIGASGGGGTSRSDLEAQYDVLQFLNSHRSSGCLPPSIIAKATAVHLDPSSPRYSASVADLLSQNPKVKVEQVPDPENPTLLLPTYGYQAKFANVTDRTTLLAQINRCPYGVGLRDLHDSYDGVVRDVAALVTAGEVIAVSNPEDKDRVLFPRGEAFLVELDGVVGMGMTERYRDTLAAAQLELQKYRLEAQEAVEEKRTSCREDENGNGTKGNTGDDTGGATGGTCANTKDEAKQGKVCGANESNRVETSDRTSKSNSATTDAADAPRDDGDGPGTKSASATTAAVEAQRKRLEEEQRTHRINAAVAKVQETRRRLELSSQLLSTDVDPLPQLRRGEAIQVGGTWFRVSSAIREGVPLEEQPTRAQAPPSVVMMRDLSKKNDAEGYVHSFAERMIPLDGKIPPEAAENLQKAKAARERLHRAAGSIKSSKNGGGSRVGVTGGASSQLLSSHASATNPESLAAAFVSSLGVGTATGGGGTGAGRKRPIGITRRPFATSGGRSTGTSSSISAGSSDGKVEDKEPTLAEIIQDAKEAVTDPSLQYIHARRHGCTKDVRQMFLATRADVPESEVELYNLMIQHKLIEPGEPMRRPRMKLQNNNLDNDGKPKKRRYYERKNQRMTNTHLIGHEIGAVLAKAAERQQQGKEVGDGGM